MPGTCFILFASILMVSKFIVTMDALFISYYKKINEILTNAFLFNWHILYKLQRNEIAYIWKLCSCLKSMKPRTTNETKYQNTSLMNIKTTVNEIPTFEYIVSEDLRMIPLSYLFRTSFPPMVLNTYVWNKLRTCFWRYFYQFERHIIYTI